jgi:hypothetical protein
VCHTYSVGRPYEFVASGEDAELTCMPVSTLRLLLQGRGSFRPGRGLPPVRLPAVPGGRGGWHGHLDERVCWLGWRRVHGWSMSGAALGCWYFSRGPILGGLAGSSRAFCWGSAEMGRRQQPHP